MTTVGIGLSLVLLHTCIRLLLYPHHAYTKEGDKDLLATISTAVKNLGVDEITDYVHIKVSFLLVLQPPQQQKWLVKYGNTITCMDAMYEKHKNEFPC